MIHQKLNHFSDMILDYLLVIIHFGLFSTDPTVSIRISLFKSAKFPNYNQSQTIKKFNDITQKSFKALETAKSLTDILLY